LRKWTRKTHPAKPPNEIRFKKEDKLSEDDDGTTSETEIMAALKEVQCNSELRTGHGREIKAIRRMPSKICAGILPITRELSIGIAEISSSVSFLFARVKGNLFVRQDRR